VQNRAGQSGAVVTQNGKKVGLGLALMQKHRALVVDRKAQLGFEGGALIGAGREVAVIIQTGFTHGHGGRVAQQRSERLGAGAGPLPRMVGVDTGGRGHQARIAGGQGGRGAGLFHTHAGDDHAGHARRDGTVNHCIAIGIEARMGEVDANINQVTVLHARILLEFQGMMNMDEAMDHRPMDWVGDWSGRRRALTPARTALIDPGSGRELSYQQLDDRARRWAHWMIDEAGLDAGDTMALITRNRLEAVELFLAAGKVGVIIAPVSHRLAADEASALIARLDPAWLAIDEALEGFADTLTGCARERPRIGFGSASAPAEQALARQRLEPVNRPLALSEPCLLVHTGGSTGLPKICQVSHRQMVWNAVELLVAADGALPRRRELALFPLFHIGGWNTVLPILYAGGCVVMPDAFDPPAVLRAIDEQRINHFGAVEAMLQAIAASPGFAEQPLACLEAITTAGAPCAESSMAPFLERGIAVRQSYGLTEAGPSNFVNADSSGGARTATDRASVGTSFFHTDYRIVDPEHLTPVSLDTPGELQMRSPHDFDGYLDDPAATTARWTSDGWMRSGDLAREDAEGRVFIVGRMDHVIVSGGENIAAEEVENTLLEHPSVTAALVFGVPDARWGARPVAWVSGPEGVPTDEVGEWLHGRLARFKHPALIQAVAELPRTGTGKPDRQAARRCYDEQTPGAQS